MERKFMQFAVGLILMLMSASGFAYSALTLAPGANQPKISAAVSDTTTADLYSDGELTNSGNAYQSNLLINLNALARTEPQDIPGPQPVQLPAPAAVWLFLTGFFGLLYLNRRH